MLFRSAILGVLIERAVGKPYAEYMQEKVWGPLGMEQDAYVTLDDKNIVRLRLTAGLRAISVTSQRLDACI